MPICRASAAGGISHLVEAGLGDEPFAFKVLGVAAPVSLDLFMLFDPRNAPVKDDPAAA